LHILGQPNSFLAQDGGLAAFGAGLLLFPRIPMWNVPHSFDAVRNLKFTGLTQNLGQL
jgi:hypothetical protein